MHMPCVVFTKSGSILDVNNFTAPYHFNEQKVEFKDKTKEIQEEFLEHQEKLGGMAESFNDFLKGNGYSILSESGKPERYGYWFNPNGFMDGYCIGGRFTTWLVRKTPNVDGEFMYFAAVSKMDVDATMENIRKIQKNQPLYAPSFIDADGKLHLAPEDYLWHPEKPENIEAAQKFRDEFLAYVLDKNNQNLIATVIDCHC